MEGVGARVVISMGFFRETCRPWRAAAMPCAAWRPEGCRMMTRSRGDAEEGVRVLIGSAAVFAAEAGDFFGIGSVDGGDFDAADSARGRAWVSVMLRRR